MQGYVGSTRARLEFQMSELRMELQNPTRTNPTLCTLPLNSLYSPVVRPRPLRCQ